MMKPQTKTIVILSDSHWRFSAKLPAYLSFIQQLKPDAILHAGDIGHINLLEALENLAPVFAVRGNCDTGILAETLPKKQVLSFDDVKIGLIHGDGARGTTPERAYQAFLQDDVQLIVFGHSHKPMQEEKENITLFNPGSCAQPRGLSPYPSLGLLKIQGNTFQVSHLYLKTMQTS